MILSRYRTRLTFLLYFLLYSSVAARAIGYFAEADPLRLPVVIVLLAGYGLLLFSESWLAPRLPYFYHPYLALQTFIIFSLLAISPSLDYYALLFVPLCIQTMLVLPLATGYRWIAIFMVAMAAGLLIAYDFWDGLLFILTYAGAFVFVTAYATTARRAEEARGESQRLLTELQAAHEQLQVYAGQVKELTLVEERNRLARELHDSVTQALYSQTLYAAAAARQLAAGELDVTADHLRDLRDGAQQALQEMRLLIFELRPLDLEEVGLAGAIQARLDAVESRAGVQALFVQQGAADLPPAVEAALYRVVQEGLNNILKHAKATTVRVELELTPARAALVIVDDGAGFDPAAANGGLGLPGMAERAQELDARLLIDSTPGRGSTIRFEVEL